MKKELNKTAHTYETLKKQSQKDPNVVHVTPEMQLHMDRANKIISQIRKLDHKWPKNLESMPY